MRESNLTARRLKSELATLESKSECRQLALMTGINLCSNDYLGLASDPRIRSALLEEISCVERIAGTGSRLLSGNSACWEELESQFAGFSGAEAALYFASGYAANVGLLSSILRPQDVVFSDSSNHASLIDGIRLSHARRVIVPHLDLDFLEDALRRHQAPGGERVIVVESVFSMEGDKAPLDALLTLAERHGASLIVDEAHATGVFGDRGRGLAAATGRPASLLATVHTAGKALAAVGAFVACSDTLKQYLINRARTFIFGTALPPYIAAQVRTALGLAEQADAQRAHLADLGTTLRGRLQDAGFNLGTSNSQIVPVILGANDYAVTFAEQLIEAGFAVRAIRPPTVKPGSARLRISLTADLSMEAIHRLAEVMIAVREKLVPAHCGQP